MELKNKSTIEMFDEISEDKHFLMELIEIVLSADVKQVNLLEIQACVTSKINKWFLPKKKTPVKMLGEILADKYLLIGLIEIALSTDAEKFNLMQVQANITVKICVWSTTNNIAKSCTKGEVNAK